MITYKPIKSKNHDARIASRVARNGKLRTETLNRDDGFSVAMTTDPKTGKTRTFVDGVGVNTTNDCTSEYVELSARQINTLIRVRNAHKNYVA